VLKAIQEIEMGGVMGLGAAGADGTVGGRLERELEVFESVVKGKRKGYREKVKARESGASNLGGGRETEDGQESGQREAKRARLEDGDHGDTQQTATRDGVASTAQMLPLPPLQHKLATMTPHTPFANTNGAAPHHPDDGRIPDDDLEDDLDDNDNADGEADDVPSEEDDEDEDEDEDEEDEDEDENERKADEDELDGYGPEDQLRHDMNGGEDEEEEGGGGEEDDGGSDGSGDESD
jgi:hypothetical protein